MRSATLLLSVCLVLALATSPAAATPLFTLDPADGALKGQLSSLVGWGLTIQNDDSGYFVVTSVNYDAVTSIGDFTDLITPQFLLLALAPNQTWSQSFDAVTSTGLGSYLIGDWANLFEAAVGKLVITYDMHSIDPTDPAYDPGLDLTYGYSVSLDASVTVVPEPTPVFGMCAGVALLWIGRRMRR